ncbi:MAG: DNA polymerase Y family protein, partial [Acetobacteraceae bacterium]|nr:DNA polymerase Y family protein [Acetobacteraceae bacterium]
MRRVVSVWLPTLPTDRLRRHTASSPPEAPLITAFHDGRRQSLAAVDAAARKLGLYPGMPLAHAQAMIPGLNVVPADPANDAATLARLVVGCLRYSPLTAPDPPDGIWIDATGCAHLFGGEEALLADLVTRLQRSGFAARAAIADTTGAAWSFAHYGEMPVTVVPAGEAAQSIANLPIAALRLASDLTEALGRLGIERIGQIMAEPRAPFARRVGPELLHRLDQATGREFEPVNPVFPADSISKRLAFAEPLLTPQAFTGVIDRLTKQVCTELERKRQGARTLDLLFERVDGSIEAVRIGTAQPNRHPKHLARLLQERLDRVDPGLGVDAMRLIASLAEPLAYTQIRAGVGGAEADANISLLVDRLANRLGAGRVYRVAPVESHVPERSIRRVAPLAPVRADRDQVESRRRSTSRESARSQNLERFHLGGNRSRA